MVATSYAEVDAVLGLRCSCRVWGAHAEIAVLRPRLRWLEHLNLSMSTSILAWAPQSWHEHRNLGMSTTILAWAPQSWHEHLNPSIGGRHRMLYFNIQRTEKYSIAMCYWPGYWSPALAFTHFMNYVFIGARFRIHICDYVRRYSYLLFYFELWPGYLRDWEYLTTIQPNIDLKWV